MKLKGFKIFEGKNGLFCKPPQTKGKNKDGEDAWFDDIQFVDSAEENTFREEVYSTIIKEYSRKVNTSSSSYKAEAASTQSSYSNQSKKSTKPLW